MGGTQAQGFSLSEKQDKTWESPWQYLPLGWLRARSCKVLVIQDIQAAACTGWPAAPPCWRRTGWNWFPLGRHL